MKGRIHSIETCGLVDGPGIRYVVFTQGCLLRCRYCHNPDTWSLADGIEKTAEEIVADLEDYVPYMTHSGGGITVSGGEPLLQPEFLLRLFTLCKAKGIHTTLDTSAGCFFGSEEQMAILNPLMDVTDLVLLDLKQIDPVKHRQLTGVPNQHILRFAEWLSERSVPVWIRHVLVPGITDGEEDLQNLGRYLRTLRNIEKIEVLPYHEMGAYKWEALGLEYTLKDVRPPSREQVERARQLLTGTNETAEKAGTSA